ncbi:hypothetical protein PF005_g14194 [Phytophthora fragariae]|uniref:Ig-like domain-containing protein n=1 Tax=Phytophthora fragariae TaxID=53985 RepID=A0A6A3XU57_9STRA|nr:hypothetical protein PF003_g18581 [Phytophthora fragariae]KAE8945643.1 hypothetical protein PF009_g4714 [Phytophthora fragariae]KAE9011025.1 hypothetical protein PF011_g9548 [Phytophthora fragariae]KAE9101884.1 hypothetical protein PF007_g14963 [Phytophthora fragariae]KAE9102660.1 hypothetical protein PF010_g14028 [Phytophthora fragariae]
MVFPWHSPSLALYGMWPCSWTVSLCAPPLHSSPVWSLLRDPSAYRPLVCQVSTVGHPRHVHQQLYYCGLHCPGLPLTVRWCRDKGWVSGM